MSHDFAKKSKPAPRKKAARKSQVPGWVWLFTGVVTGVFICFLAYLAGITPQSDDRKVKQPKASASKVTTAAKPDTTTKFDFYTLLPEREVIVPDEPEEARGKAPAEATVYILQAGSFKTAADADRLRARLILMGLEARVDVVTSDNGDQWHRVQVGPFRDRSKLSKARSTLISEGIDTLVMKRKA